MGRLPWPVRTRLHAATAGTYAADQATTRADKVSYIRFGIERNVPALVMQNS